jgi:nicotinamide riboside kinase
VLVGAESTGKTTLAQDLAAALGARWVPEYGREYTYEKLAREGGPRGRMEDLVWTTADFVAIARAQNELEATASESGGAALVCDTDTLATSIWHERYLGARAPEVEALELDAPSLYLLTHPDDVPFAADEIRDGENLRTWMTQRFVEPLDDAGFAWCFVRGDREERAREAAILVRLATVGSRRVPSLRALRRELSRELRDVPGTQVLRLAENLIATGRCPRWFAYELAHHHAGAMARLSAAAVGRLGAGLAAWEEVDTFGSYLLGPAWREGRVSDAHLRAWARSEDRWRRRSALVATVALNVRARGGRGDAKRTLALCDLLRDDRDDKVVKAFSWALRALAEREPERVRRYLTRNEKRLAARVLREVRHKLVTGLKNPRKRKRS